MSIELACFISPHGYGHATRTIGLLQALQRLVPDLRARLFTTAPASLFQASGVPFTRHQLSTDVGLVQRDAFCTDRQETLHKLAALIPFEQSLISDCARLCRSSRLVLCDISCLGIEVGRAAGIPSVLVENFTWDWIYSQMGEQRDLGPFIDYFSRTYRKADYRIQTDPVCTPLPSDLHCYPMARRLIDGRQRLRDEIGPIQRQIVLVSMGGVPLDLPFLGQLQHYQDCLFIIAGQNRGGFIGDNVRLLGADDHFHHPDLINAADLLICKSGYSTVAECAQTRTPIGCVSRDNFAESKILEAYVTGKMNGAVLDQNHFFSGDWLDNLESLMANARKPAPVNGADQAAEFIATLR